MVSHYRQNNGLLNGQNHLVVNIEFRFGQGDFQQAVCELY